MGLVVIAASLILFGSCLKHKTESLTSTSTEIVSTAPMRSVLSRQWIGVVTVQNSNDPVVIRDKGASFVMIPRTTSNQASAFLPESSVRAMQGNNNK